jgi:UDP-N-acetylglucosamine:LPS N-acetylglucosamine transferase
MDDAGAALLFQQSDLTADSLAARLAELLDSPASLERMQSMMHSLARPRAAAEIVDWLVAQRRA